MSRGWEAITPVLGNEFEKSLFEENLSLLCCCSCCPVTVPPRSYQRGLWVVLSPAVRLWCQSLGQDHYEWVIRRVDWMARQHICVLLDEMTILWEKDVGTLAGQPTRFVLISLPVSCLILIFKVWNISIYMCVRTNNVLIFKLCKSIIILCDCGSIKHWLFIFIYIIYFLHNPPCAYFVPQHVCVHIQYMIKRQITVIAGWVSHVQIFFASP